MPTVMITGAGRGLGLEFARQYAQAGWRVLATCRKPRAAKELAAIEGDVVIRELDVTDYERVHQLAKLTKKQPIDLLILNAGVYGPRPQPLGGIDLGIWEDVMEINVMAPLNLVDAFVDHVAKSQLKLIVAMSSKMGSMTDNTSGGSYIYRSSKAALNAVMRSLAADLKGRGVSVLMVHPGWVKTDMGGPTAPVEQTDSVTGLRKVFERPPESLNGRFINYDGTEIPW